MTVNAHPSKTVDILVIGEAIMDIVEDGPTATEHPGGSPANVAVGIGRRGIDVAFRTDISRDPRGSRIVRHLERSGVQVLSESFSDRATSTATARVAANGSASYVFDVRWNLPPAPPPLSATLVHTGSIAAFLEPGRQSLMEQLDAATPRIVTVDPNIRPALLGSHAKTCADFEELAERAQIVKMSDEDAAWLYPGLTPGEVGAHVVRLGPRLAVLTLGSAGAILTTPDSHLLEPSVPATVADTIGAGDTYMASLIVDILRLADRPLDDAALTMLGRRAAHAAAITVSRPGADLPWKHELPPWPCTVGSADTGLPLPTPPHLNG